MKEKKLSISKKVLYLLLVLSLGLGLFFIFNKPVSKLESYNDLEILFNQISNQLTTDNRVTEFDSSREAWWIDTDNLDLAIPTQLSIGFIIKNDSNNPNRNKDLDQICDNLNKIVKNNLSRHGFKINTRNSSKNKDDNQFYDYIQAYESGQFICLAESPIIEEMGNWFHFYCFTSDQVKAARERQLPFIKILQSKNSIIYDLEIIDNYAKGNHHARRVGSTAYFYKNNNQWELLWDYQDLPMCTEFSEKNIPTKYWTDCYDQQMNIHKGSDVWSN